jgi:hypothetical protein
VLTAITTRFESDLCGLLRARGTAAVPDEKKDGSGHIHTGRSEPWKSACLGIVRPFATTPGRAILKLINGRIFGSRLIFGRRLMGAGFEIMKTRPIGTFLGHDALSLKNDRFSGHEDYEVTWHRTLTPLYDSVIEPLRETA